MTHEEEHVSDDSDDRIDKAVFSLPEGKFSITTGRNGALSLCIGAAVVIMAIGFGTALVLSQIWK